MRNNWAGSWTVRHQALGLDTRERGEQGSVVTSRLCCFCQDDPIQEAPCTFCMVGSWHPHWGQPAPVPSPAKEAEPHPNCPCSKEKAASLNTLRADVVGEMDFHVGCQRPQVFLSRVGPSQGPQQPHRKLQPAGWWGRTQGGLQGLCSGVYLRSGALPSLTTVPWPMGASKRPGNAVELCTLVNALPQREVPFLPFSFWTDTTKQNKTKRWEMEMFIEIHIM